MKTKKLWIFLIDSLTLGLTVAFCAKHDWKALIFMWIGIIISAVYSGIKHG